MAKESILDPANPGTDRTKDRVLLTLKSRGPQSTSVLARLLGISIPGVRQHLNSLTQEGLIQHQTVRKGVGRPAHEWALTPAAHDRFPDTHAEMTVALIASIRDKLGARALDAVIDHRHQQTREGYRAQLEAASTLDEKLARLTSIRTEEGYMADLTAMEDGSWLLAENHCPICAAARSCQGFCRSELELFCEVLGDGVIVERVEYLLEGARRCAYRIASGPR